MARIRTIKPEFFDHVGLFDAEQETGLPIRLAYIGLWTQADREGRFIYEPRRLKARVLPYDDVDFSRVLDALATRGFIQIYIVDGKKYAWIPSWHLHQSINNKEKDSSLPGIEDADANPKEIETSNALATRGSRVDDACPELLGKTQGERNRNKEQGKEQGTGTGKEQVPQTTREAREDVSPKEIHAVFDHYRTYKPKSTPKPNADMKTWKKIRARFQEGYSLEDLCNAIDGCFASPFHQGENEHQRKYDSLELITRDADHVQQFLDLFDQRGSPVLSQRTMKNQRAATGFLERYKQLGLDTDE